MAKLELRRSVHLRTLFLQYLAVFCVMVILLTGAFFSGFLVLLSSGAVMPANAVETQVQQVVSQLDKGVGVDLDKLPSSCQYAVFGSDGSFESGNVSRSEAENIRNAADGEQRSTLPYVYKSAHAGSRTYLFRYEVRSSYANGWANTHLPSPGVLFGVLYLVCFLVGTALIASRFARQLSKKLSGLNDVAQKIQEKDLDFAVTKSGIYEIDRVLASFEEMRSALKDSLEAQWDMEHARATELAALAHDIKTPATIVSGNAELLRERLHDKELLAYVASIQSGIAQLQDYAKQIIDISRDTAMPQLVRAPVSLNVLIERLGEQIKDLASSRRVTIQERHPVPDQMIDVDEELMFRALANVCINAIEHTPEGGRVLLEAEGSDNAWSFVITDGGDGFGPDELANATKEFWRGKQAGARDGNKEQKDRAASDHYGMGLFIARRICERHGGAVTLQNSPEGTGVVTLTVRSHDVSGL